MKFYVLRSPHLEEGKEPELAVTDFVPADPVNRGEASKCPLCGQPVGMLPWLPPYRVELDFWGKEAGDIAFFGDDLLVSDRFRRLWGEANLIGLGDFHPVETIRTRSYGKRKGIKPQGNYYYVEIATSRALVDDQASELVRRPNGRFCDECGAGDPERAERIVLKEHTWSGEDMFYVRDLPGRIVTSERYRDFHVANKINNGVLIEASHYSFNWRPGPGYKPG